MTLINIDQLWHGKPEWNWFIWALHSQIVNQFRIGHYIPTSAKCSLLTSQKIGIPWRWNMQFSERSHSWQIHSHWPSVDSWFFRSSLASLARHEFVPDIDICKAWIQRIAGGPTHRARVMHEEGTYWNHRTSKNLHIQIYTMMSSQKRKKKTNTMALSLPSCCHFRMFFNQNVPEPTTNYTN